MNRSLSLLYSHIKTLVCLEMIISSVCWQKLMVATACGESLMKNNRLLNKHCTKFVNFTVVASPLFHKKVRSYHLSGEYSCNAMH